jgi:hypothetical protein
VDTFGRLDGLVNNAGYGQFAPFEQMSAEDFQAVVDTCFYGVVYTTRAAISLMRNQRSGHIFQVSSVGGRLAVAGNTPYHAAKWAVGGFSDALALEVAPFGLKICTLEPGGIRTNWARLAGQNAPDLLPDYEASVGSMLKLLRGVEGRLEGDPSKIADVVVRLANSNEVPVRLILGVDAEKHVAPALNPHQTRPDAEGVQGDRIPRSKLGRDIRNSYRHEHQIRHRHFGAALQKKMPAIRFSSMRKLAPGHESDRTLQLLHL